MMGLVDLFVMLTMGSVLIAVKGGEWNGDDCNVPLGMESGKIPTSRITASSSFDEKSVGPQNARIRQEHNGGAWCPKDVIRDGVKEYLEIDFSGDYRVSQTETQGRFGNGRGLEFAEQFQLEYYREKLDRWFPYKDHFGKTIFDANSNTYLSVTQQLNPPFIASRLRFIPYSVHPRTVCMRVEAYGCHFTEGVIHYECPQGYWKKNPDVDLRDSSYDGWMDENGILQGGLGLLVDSLLGPNDFRVPHANKGNMWIGWDNQSTPVKVGFQFDGMRKFHEVSIHVNNFVSQGAQVFASVDIYFSMDGHKFSEFPMRWTPKEDLKNETAYLVHIPLRGRLAVYVRMEFYHSNHWLLLSEIFFRSDVFTGNVTDDVHSLNFLQDGPEDNSAEKRSSQDGVGGNSSTTSSVAIIGLIAGSLSVLVLLSIVALVCFVFRRNRRNTKLVGVIGMTPKSMSMGLGCSDSNSQKHSSSSATAQRVGKIALYDLKPVSISGETDSDESLYHELVFSLGGGCGSVSKSEDSTGSSSNQTFRKNTNKKIKYQRVNHGGDFSGDFMGLRSVHDELSYFHQSSPSTPVTGPKQKVSHVISHPHQQHQSVLVQPIPQSTFHKHRHLDPQQQQHQHHHLHHPLLTLQSKTFSLGNGNCNSAPPTNSTVFTTSSSSKSSSAIPSAVSVSTSTLGFFHSPRGRRSGGAGGPGSVGVNKTSESNYYAATDIFQVSDAHFDRF